MARSGFP
eukprot:PRCOL_00007047-RA